MSEEEILKFLSNTYDTDRITFEIYTKHEYGEKHIKGKINFEKGILGYGFDLTTDRKTKEEIEEKINRFILYGFLLRE